MLLSVRRESCGGVLRLSAPEHGVGDLRGPLPVWAMSVDFADQIAEWPAVLRKRSPVGPAKLAMATGARQAAAMMRARRSCSASSQSW
jgi:hypothetical protein